MPRPTWVTKTVVGIVVATFFSDVGHEMVTAVLPLYLEGIGLGPAALGAMEGAADLAFSAPKLWSARPLPPRWARNGPGFEGGIGLVQLRSFFRVTA